MDIMEAITKKLQSHAAGYKSNHPLFKSLTPGEVEEYMKSASDCRFITSDASTPMSNIEVWHPVTRLQLMLHIAHSLHTQGEL